MTKTENNILLFSITFCWAASYVFIKNFPDGFSSYAYLTMTTGLAALILTAVFWERFKGLTIRLIGKSFFLALVLAANLIIEKEGIDRLPSSNASFIAALTILIVPLFMLFFHVKPTLNSMVGAGVIVFGLCLTSRFSLVAFLNMGSLFMLLSCVASAIFTIAVDRFTKQEDPLLIGVVQMIFTALIGFVLWYFENPATFFSITYTNELLSTVFILAFFSKAYAYITLMYAQKYTDPISVTVIGSTEPVVTLILAVIIPSAYGRNESFAFYTLLGAVCIVLGSVISQIQLKKNKEESMHAN